MGKAKRFPDVKPLYAGLLSVSVRRRQVTGLSDGRTTFQALVKHLRVA